MPIQSKTEPTKISASEWQTPGGVLEGKGLNTSITLLRYVTDVVGEGPTLHVHPYDEIFTITEGRARFTVGDKTIDAEAGDVVLGPQTSHTAIRIWGRDDLIHWTFTPVLSGFSSIWQERGISRVFSFPPNQK